MSRDDIRRLVEITGKSEDLVKRYLEYANNNVEQALEMLFDAPEGSSPDGRGSSSIAGDRGGNKRPLHPLDVPVDEEGVRAPDAIKKQRLIDSPYAAAPGLGVNPFRDFGSEGMFGRGPSSAAGQRGLSELFGPPRKIVFRGSFQEARDAAKQQRRWLLVNVVMDDNFASHLLNRDVWKDPMVELSQKQLVLLPCEQAVVRSGFIFWQVPSRVPEGMQYCHRHHITEGELPHIGVLDPRTQRMLFQMCADDPLDRDTILDRLTDVCGRFSFEESATMPAPMPPPRPRPVIDRSEDEQIALAIAESLKEQGSDGEKEVVEVFDDDDEDDYEDAKEEQEKVHSGDKQGEQEALSRSSSDVQYVETRKSGTQAVSLKADQEPIEVDEQEEEVTDKTTPTASSQSAGPSSLPYKTYDLQDEPQASAGVVTRIQFRLPEGKKLVRRFKLEDPVAAMYAYVRLELQDASDGKPFDLATVYPAASLWSHMVAGCTIQEAKLDNAAVVLTWKETD